MGNDRKDRSQSNQVSKHANTGDETIYLPATPTLFEI